MLLLIIAVGSFLRIYDLGAESLWADEVISVDFSSKSVTSIIIQSPFRDNPPFYWVILHYWMIPFGISEVAVRSLSVVLGIGAILITYFIGRELFSQRVGLIAGFLSAISYFHIFYSQEARPYALMLFLSLLSYFFFIKILKQDKKSYYIGYFLANLLLGYTHVYGFFTMASQILFFVFFWSKYKVQRWKLIATLVATFFGLVPLAFLLGHRALTVAAHGFWTPVPTLRSIFNTFTMYAGYGYRSDTYILLLFFLVLAFIGLFSVTRTGGKWILRKPLYSLKGLRWKIGFESTYEWILLAMWLSCPIAISFIISHSITSIYQAKYTIGASPALFLLIAKGVSTINTKKWLYSILLVIIILSSFGLHTYYVRDVKTQWREAAYLVEVNSNKGDVIVFCAEYGGTPFDYYYHGDLPEFGIRKNANTKQVENFVNDVVSGRDRLWLIWYQAGPALLRNYLTDKYAILLEKPFEGGESPARRVSVLLFDLGPLNEN